MASEEQSPDEELDLTGDLSRRVRTIKEEGRQERLGIREKARLWLALVLAGILFVDLVAGILLVWSAQFSGEAKSLFEVSFSALVGLVGSATGFYFGARGDSQ